MPLAQKVVLSTVAVLLIAVITIGAIHVHRQMNPEIIAVAPLDPGCDLQRGNCTSYLPGRGGIEIEIAPRPIQASAPLQLTVRTPDLKPESVEVDFRGLGMNMGYNRPVLERGADGYFRAQGNLSSCTLSRMQWEATVLAKTKDGIVAAPFRFETVRQ